MGFLNRPIKTYISKSGSGVFTTPVPLRHTTMFTYSHANTPLGQSERAYYLSYFITQITNIEQVPVRKSRHQSKRCGWFLPNPIVK